MEKQPTAEEFEKDLIVDDLTPLLREGIKRKEAY